MSLLEPDEDRIGELAGPLALAPQWVSPSTFWGQNFAAYTRELRETATFSREKRSKLWLHGTWRDSGVRTVVTVNWLNPYNERWQDSRGRFRDREIAYTVAAVEIDPPLFCGLRLSTRGVNLFDPTDLAEASVHPSLSVPFRAWTWDNPRMHALFGPMPGRHDLVSYVVGVRGLGFLIVNDSMVRVFEKGVVLDPGKLSTRIDQAVWIAKELGERAKILGPRKEDEGARAAWKAVAERLGFTFDPARMMMGGKYKGLDAGAMWESEPWGVVTTVRMNFPHALQNGLFMSKQGEKPVYRNLFATEFEETTLGYPDVDAAFEVFTNHQPYASHLFRDPELRRAAVDLVTRSQLFTITDREVNFRISTPSASEQEIVYWLDAVAFVVDRIARSV